MFMSCDCTNSDSKLQRGLLVNKTIWARDETQQEAQKKHKEVFVEITR